MNKNNVDILIVGGGLVGITLLIALQNTEYNVLLINNDIEEKIIKKKYIIPIVLFTYSKKILEKLGIWHNIKDFTTLIKKTYISANKHFGSIKINHDIENYNYCYVITIDKLYNILCKLAKQEQILSILKLENIDIQNRIVTVNNINGLQYIKFKIIIAADGSHSVVRNIFKIKTNIKYYNQKAIITNVYLEKPNYNCAYEYFTKFGSLAILPIDTDQVSIIWILQNKEALYLYNVSNNKFLFYIQRIFGNVLGKCMSTHSRFIYPLCQVIANNITNWPLVLIGNAAHTIHPIAGQGFNLSLRDIYEFMNCLYYYKISYYTLNRYELMRQNDINKTIYFTDQLLNIFTINFPGIRLIRSLGIFALGNISLFNKILKNIIFNRYGI